MNNYFGIDLAKEGHEYTSTVALIDNINTILTVPARQEPVASADIIDCLTKMGALLDENNHSEDRYFVLPPAILPNRKLKSRAWKKAFKKTIRNGFYIYWRPNKKQWYNNKITEYNSKKVFESPHCEGEKAYTIKAKRMDDERMD